MILIFQPEDLLWVHKPLCGATVTDDEWYRFLAARPEVSEAVVKFWRPGGGRRPRSVSEL